MLKNNIPAVALGALLVMCLALFADTAFAAKVGTSTIPTLQALEQIRNFITGPFAYTISVLALVAAGSALAFGNDIGGFIRTLLYVACVISFIVMAVNFLGALFSGAVIPDYVLYGVAING